MNKLKYKDYVMFRGKKDKKKDRVLIRQNKSYCRLDSEKDFSYLR